MISQNGKSTRAQRRIRPIHVAAAGLIIGAGLIVRVLAPAGWELSALASFGVEEEQTLRYAEERLGTVTARPLIGHDGRFFFIQANDPLMLAPAANAMVLDRPTYRSQRMLYPLLAGGAGLLSPGLILWGLVLVNLVSVGLGTFALARYASWHGLSPWLGLALPLNPGVIHELTIDGAGVLALALAIGAVLAWEKDRDGIGVALLVLAALTREVMLVAAFGVALWLLLRGRRRAAWLSGALPLAAVIGWAAYVRWRIPGDEIAEIEEIGVPLVGLAEAFQIWVRNPSHMLVAVVILICMVMLGSQLWRGRSDLLGYAAGGFAVLALFLTAQVWLASFDITRAVAPVLTAIIVNPRFGARKDHSDATVDP